MELLKKSEFLIKLDLASRQYKIYLGAEQDRKWLVNKAISMLVARRYVIATLEFSSSHKVDAREDPIVGAVDQIARIKYDEGLKMKNLIAIERAWECYQEKYNQEFHQPSVVADTPSGSGVVGRFGPKGNMQGPDHPLRRS